MNVWEIAWSAIKGLELKGIDALHVGVIIMLIVCTFLLITAVKCLLRSEMLKIYYHNIESGKIRQYENENFLMLYKAYKALRGNSFIDKIYEEIDELDVIS